MWLTELKKIGYDLLVFASGVAGTFVLKRKEPDFVWWRFILDLIAGGLTAMHVTPLFMMVLNVNDNVELAIAFGIGLMGYKAVDLVVEILSTLMRKK